MEASSVVTVTRFPILRWHHPRTGVLGVGAGLVAATDGAVAGAVVAGIFALTNTVLTVWLTGKREDRAPGKRRRRRQEDDKRRRRKQEDDGE